MRMLFRPQARTEVLEAQAWYESRATGLGLEFARAVDAAVASAVRNPEMFALVTGSCRRVLLAGSRSPWSTGFAAMNFLSLRCSITSVIPPSWSIALGANNSLKPMPLRGTA